jgi:magnesium-transporting ATPase (P-type)
MNRFQKLAYAGLAVLPNASLPVGGAPVTLSEIQDRIQQIAQFLIIVSMVIAVIFIVYGGIRYITSSGDPADAKKIIWNGIIGAAIILAVGVILQTVAGLVTRSFFS